MQTALADFIRDTDDGREAEAILRRCVHCGFCTATCPTYQLLGDELDGPRGRIYLMKQVLEGHPATESTQLHLDRCLTCRSCETTCPSGVEYGKLVEIGRRVVEQQVGRSVAQRAIRATLKDGLTSSLFAPAMRLGQAMRPLLPGFLKAKVPLRRAGGSWPARAHPRRVVMLEGCVQPSMSPNINTATARVADALGIEMLRPPAAGCCGAIRLHLNDREAALDDMRRNVDAWHGLLEAGAEAIVINASGCGSLIKEYGHQLRDDPAYAERAARVADSSVDLGEWLAGFGAELAALVDRTAASHVAYHPPCTLQHGQQSRGFVEGLLRSLGFQVSLPADSHLCCGSAGTYSVLQPELAGRLRALKVDALEATGAATICSSNIGCITHIESATDRPVLHWIELVDAALKRSRPS
ncbi:glycolate oxidase subunit GlcF [soil metagenome]